MLQLIPVLFAVLFALLLYPEHSSNPFSLTNPTPSTHQKILFITAHPDDEALFFAPPLIALTRSNITTEPLLPSHDKANHSPDVYSLCLSTGNADGLGHVRVTELKKSLDLLGVPDGKRWVLDSPYVPFL